jgi:hypothetical protein
MPNKPMLHLTYDDGGQFGLDLRSVDMLEYHEKEKSFRVLIGGNSVTFNFNLPPNEMKAIFEQWKRVRFKETT